MGYSGDSRQFISRCLSRFRPAFSSADQFCVRRASNNIFFDDGRFLRLKQSLNNPSTNRRSLSNHQKTGFFSVCRWLVDIKAFRITLLSAGRHRLTTENWPRIAGLSGDFDKSTDGSLINWSHTHLVTSKYFNNCGLVYAITRLWKPNCGQTERSMIVGTTRRLINICIQTWRLSLFLGINALTDTSVGQSYLFSWRYEEHIGSNLILTYK